MAGDDDDAAIGDRAGAGFPSSNAVSIVVRVSGSLIGISLRMVWPTNAVARRAPDSGT